MAFEPAFHLLQPLCVFLSPRHTACPREGTLLVKHERYEYLPLPAGAASPVPSEVNDESAERAFKFNDSRVDVYALKALAEQLIYFPTKYSFPSCFPLRLQPIERVQRGILCHCIGRQFEEPRQRAACIPFDEAPHAVPTECGIYREHKRHPAEGVTFSLCVLHIHHRNDIKFQRRAHE